MQDQDDSPVWLLVQVSTQQLLLQREDTVLACYPISTALAGVGEQDGSGCTPRGEHVVVERYGDGLPVGTVFVARQPTGEIYDAALAAAWPERDWILTRILRLSGCEPGVNQGEGCDSYTRYIYIHGTPDTEPMGEARSHGCVRMRNADLLQLFEQVPLGTRVRIEA